MKALKINTKVQLTSDLSVISGAICTIAKSRIYEDQRYEINGSYLYPSSVIVNFYASEAAFLKGAAPLGDIVGIPTTLLEKDIDENTYQKISTEDYTIAIAAAYLETVYPGAIVEITI